MNKRMAYGVGSGVLALAAILAWRGCAPVFRNAAAARGGQSAKTVKMSAYEAQIKALAVIDESVILYRELAPLVPRGVTVLSALAVGPDDRLYIGSGRLLVVLSPQGDEIRRTVLNSDVTCLAADAQGTLYVGLGSTVQVLDTEGRQTVAFTGIGADAIITSIAATEDAVFVADARSQTVLRFTPDGVLRQTITGKTGHPDALGFIVPSPYFDIMLGQGDTLWIVNPGRHRLEEYTFQGERIDWWPELAGMAVESFCGCCNPAHVARLANGSIVTSEKGLSRVKVYSKRGEFRGVVAAPNQFDGSELSHDLAVDSKDRILMVDADRLQIRVFELK